MSTAEGMPKCAACGKGGDGLKTCTACKVVKYCNATCQKVHRPKHKKECQKRAAETFDEALFKQPRRKGCPICMLPLPLMDSETKYFACCGKTICVGCICAGVAAGDVSTTTGLCPFCRAPAQSSDGEQLERIKKRVEAGDPEAIKQLGFRYSEGEDGLPQDHDRAHELWLRAGKLGCATAYHILAVDYFNGEGVERDMKKAKYYDGLAAMGGDVRSRHNLGVTEGIAGNIDRALKHFMISAGAGYDDSLQKIRDLFMAGHATKDDFEKALRAHKDAKDEMKSDPREEAAAMLTQYRAAGGQLNNVALTPISFA